MIARAMLRLVATSVARPLGVLAVALALVAGSAFYAASHFAMTTDTAALISPDIEWRKNERAVETAEMLLYAAMARVTLRRLAETA